MSDLIWRIAIIVLAVGVIAAMGYVLYMLLFGGVLD